MRLTRSKPRQAALPTPPQQALTLLDKWDLPLGTVVLAEAISDSVLHYIRLVGPEGRSHLWAAHSRTYRDDVAEEVAELLAKRERYRQRIGTILPGEDNGTK